MQLELHLVLISHPYRNEIAPWFILLPKKLQTSVALSYMLKPVGCCWFTINCITLLILWNVLKLHSGTRNKAQGLLFLQQDTPCVGPVLKLLIISKNYNKLPENKTELSSHGIRDE